MYSTNYPYRNFSECLAAQSKEIKNPVSQPEHASEKKIGVIQDDGWRALCEEAQNGHTEFVKLLLDRGAKAKIDKNSYPISTPLYIAAENGHIEVVKLLLDYGANINQIKYDRSKWRLVKTDRRTALHVAAELGYTEIVKLLLDRGAKIDVNDNNGCTPLHTAVKQGHIDIVKVLIKKGAKIYKTNKGGKSAFELAKEKKNDDIIRFIENFKQKMCQEEILNRNTDFSFSEDNYVLIRLWAPRIGNKETSYYSVAGIAEVMHEAIGNIIPAGIVGHLSMAIRHAKDEKYMSHWPGKEITTNPDKESPRMSLERDEDGCVSSCNSTLKCDLDREGKPSKYIVLYGLDTQKMIDKFPETAKTRWCLRGKQTNKYGDIAYNCSSAVYELLKAGGLFKYYLCDKDKLRKGQSTPIDVANLCEKARKIETDIYPETADLLSKTIEQELMEVADPKVANDAEIVDSCGTAAAEKFLNDTKPDYDYLYQTLVPQSEYWKFSNDYLAYAEEVDEERRESLKERASIIAKQGSLEWQKMLAKFPNFYRVTKNLFKDDYEVFVEKLDEIIKKANEEQLSTKAKALLELMGDLKDINIKSSDEQWKIKACHHNQSTVYKKFDEYMEDLYTNLSIVDENGLNALHIAILKGDRYCTEKLLNRFPEAINVLVGFDDNNKQKLIKTTVGNLGLFSGANVNLLAGCSPLDLGRFRNDIMLVDLLLKRGAKCMHDVTNCQRQSSPNNGLYTKKNAKNAPHYKKGIVYKNKKGLVYKK